MKGSGRVGFSKRNDLPFQATKSVACSLHDFLSRGEGKRIPHGIYDLARNEGYLHLNTSHDTSGLCCDSIAMWWERHGRQHHPTAPRWLLLCDGGGSNAANRHIFKEDLQALADRLGLEIRVAHYPPLYVLFHIFQPGDALQRTDEEVALMAHPGGRSALKLRACP